MSFRGAFKNAAVAAAALAGSGCEVQPALPDRPDAVRSGDDPAFSPVERRSSDRTGAASLPAPVLEFSRRAVQIASDPAEPITEAKKEQLLEAAREVFAPNSKRPPAGSGIASYSGLLADHNVMVKIDLVPQAGTLHRLSVIQLDPSSKRVVNGRTLSGTLDVSDLPDITIFSGKRYSLMGASAEGSFQGGLTLLRTDGKPPVVVVLPDELRRASIALERSGMPAAVPDLIEIAKLNECAHFILDRELRGLQFETSPSTIVVGGDRKIRIPSLDRVTFDELVSDAVTLTKAENFVAAVAVLSHQSAARYAPSRHLLNEAIGASLSDYPDLVVPQEKQAALALRDRIVSVKDGETTIDVQALVAAMDQDPNLAKHLHADVSGIYLNFANTLLAAIRESNPKP